MSGWFLTGLSGRMKPCFYLNNMSNKSIMLHYRSGLFWRMMIGSGWFLTGLSGRMKPCFYLNDMSSGYRISQTQKEIVSEQARI